MSATKWRAPSNESASPDGRARARPRADGERRHVCRARPHLV